MGRRLALLIATSSYQDEGLRRVTTTASADVEALAGVLRDPNIGGFEIATLVDAPHGRVGAAIDELYRARGHDDLTLLYVSGHALLDGGGQLHFATADTRRADLVGTGVPASRVQNAMAASASRTVLVLDCGYGGVIGPGYPVQVGATVGVLQRFGGPGRAVLTASDVLHATVDGHLQAGADMILGAAASGISLDVIDTVTGACTVQFSPSNTSTAFLELDDDDLYFRTAPSDVLQGLVIADMAIADGVGSMAVLYRQDSYGRGLDVFFRTFYQEQGGSIVADRGYDPESPDHSTDVNEVLAANPEGLVLIGFDESAEILHGLFAQGFTPDQKHIYLVDGNTGNALGEDFAGQPGALDGVTGTYTAAQLTDSFRQQMLDHYPDLIDFLYGPETYDAVVITALAAESAGTDRADEIARQINGVTRDGTECTGFVECRDLIAAGEDIDYTGLSGPLDFSQPGEPTTASFAVETFGFDNQLDPDRTEFVFARL